MIRSLCTFAHDSDLSSGNAVLLISKARFCVVWLPIIQAATRDAVSTSLSKLLVPRIVMG